MQELNLKHAPVGHVFLCQSAKTRPLVTPVSLFPGTGS